MRLHVRTNHETFDVESWPEKSAAIQRILSELKSEHAAIIDGHELYNAGDVAEFTFNDHALLRVCVNNQAGYGALTWIPLPSLSGKSDLLSHTWVSDNPRPPETDPKLVADAWVPYFHDRRNAILIPDLRQALEEFCRTGTGDRPESILWVKGNINGQRFSERESAG